MLYHLVGALLKECYGSTYVNPTVFDNRKFLLWTSKQPLIHKKLCLSNKI